MIETYSDVDRILFSYLDDIAQKSQYLNEERISTFPLSLPSLFVDLMLKIVQNIRLDGELTEQFVDQTKIDFPWVNLEIFLYDLTSEFCHQFLNINRGVRIGGGNDKT